MAEKPRVNIWAPVLGTTGYACHARGLALALQELGTTIHLEPSDINPDWKQRLPDALHASVLNSEADATIAIQLPPAWNLKKGSHSHGRKKFYGFAVFEGSRMPRSWETYFTEDFVTEVWFPSLHSINAFHNSYNPDLVTAKPRIIPHGVNTAIYTPEGSKLPGMENPEFKFLFVGGWKDGERDRKGLDIALRAFCAEFTKEEKVQFIVKINTAYGPAQKVITDLESLKLPDKNQRPLIRLIFDNLTEEQMAQLYRSADALVMPSKAEAFCLPIMESLACGTPAIATKYGGQEEYLTAAEGALINIERMEPATGESWIYADTEWARPSQKHLQEIMRSAFDQQELWKNKKQACVYKASLYSWKATAEKVLNALKE